MKRTIFIVIGLLALIVGSSNAHSAVPPSTPVPEVLAGAYVLNEILIGLEPDGASLIAQKINDAKQVDIETFGIRSLDNLNRQYKVQAVIPLFSHLNTTDAIAQKYGLHGIIKLVVLPGTDIFEMMSKYREDPAVQFAELNRVYRTMEIPNDKDFSKQWGLHNTGQTGGLAGADINAPEAWDISKGSPKVLIAIVDTGVDYYHPDLSGGRVRVDLGRDFVNKDYNAMDDHGHGTYVAGIAAADTSNGIGIAGVCRECQILPIKVLNQDGSGTAEWVAQGIQYAAQAGAKIINMSLGYPSDCGCSYTVARAINYAFDSGSLLIAASGNNSDKQRTSYPASSTRVMAVGASDHKDTEAYFSNRDGKLAIMAPGEDIYSLKPRTSYDTGSGTSAAAPHVSGAAGLVFSHYPNFENSQVWWQLFHSADNFPAGKSAFQAVEITLKQSSNYLLESQIHKLYLPSVIKLRNTYGRLNAQSALSFKMSGRIFPPEDTCSGEPDCPPGCGAEMTLVSSISAWEKLQLLRRFRDDYAASFSTGRHWIEVYDHHKLELARILFWDESIREEAKIALENWLPLIKKLIEPNSAGPSIIHLEHVQLLKSFLDHLISRSSPEYKQDLMGAYEIVDLVEAHVGKDISEFWDTLVSQGK